MAGIREGDKRAVGSVSLEDTVPRLFHVRNMFFSEQRCWPVSDRSGLV
jgi:hypothetical protein